MAAELLLAAGADKNCRDHKGGTPLHDAVDGGHEALVQVLLAAGAGIEARKATTFKQQP